MDYRNKKSMICKDMNQCLTWNKFLGKVLFVDLLAQGHIMEHQNN